MKTTVAWAISGVSLACCGILAYNAWGVQRENQKLSLLNVIHEAEYRIIKDEVAEKNSQPTYKDGYREALLRAGRPQGGTYRDGWDDAMTLVGTQTDYATGYHTAIEQFGYAKNQAIIQPSNKPDKSEKEGVTTKLEK